MTREERTISLRGVSRPSTAPSRARMLWRGFTRRCARCGSGKLFRRWFSMVDDCPRCGLHFEREEGYFVGAMAINICVVIVVFGVSFVSLLLATWPDPNVVLLIVVLGSVNAAFPVFFYPFSKTIWLAVDRAFLQQMDRTERLDEQVSVGGNVSRPPTHR